MIGLFTAVSLSGYETHPDTMAAINAARAGSKADRLVLENKALQANLEKSMLISEAIWELLRDKAKLTDADLQKKIHEIDMRDGVLDGKNKRQAVACPDCGRKVSPRHPACIYCGKVIDTSVFTVD
jgi:hypothetical protein